MTPTMAGFTWSASDASALEQLPGNLWCVRDAFSALLGWPPGSPDWKAFIQAPAPGDMDRLIEHLGLEWFDPEYPPHAEQLALRLDHPGIYCWNLHAVPIAHVIYEPHLRCPNGLPAQYAGLQPELFRVIVDVRQPPR